MHQGVFEQNAHDLEDPLRIAARAGGSVAGVFKRVLRRQSDAGELLDRGPGEACQVERLGLDVQAPGVEPREVEQVVGQLRQPPHLAGHRLEELPPGRLVELLVLE